MKSNDRLNYLQKQLQIIKNYYQVRDFDSVIQKSRIVLKQFPDQIVFFNALGLAYKEKGELDLAEETLLKGLKINPKEVNILCNLGLISKAKQKTKEAAEYYKRSLKIFPDHIPSIVNFANLKKDLGLTDDAIKLLLKALKINDQLSEVHINLAIAYKSIGKFDLTKKHCEFLNDKYPNLTIADNLLSQITDYSKNNEHQAIMVKKIVNKDLSIMDEIYLNFGIAKSYEDQNKFELSLEFLNKGNNIKRNSLINYKFENEISFFNNIKKLNKSFTFTKNFQSHKKFIFIVGLPRSGTTLTHQIFSQHSNIYGAGELTYFNYLMDNLKLDLILDKNEKFSLNEIGSNFIKKIDSLNISEEIIVDKTPENFLWIGLIKLLFPESKIIHCKRQVKDTAFSIYKNLFQGSSYGWSYNKDELARYIKLYFELIHFWDQEFPDDIFHSDYEALVLNPEAETKKLFDFCDLSWSKEFLNVEKSNTPIDTLSSAQARKPIYSNSVNYYKNFENLTDLFSKL